MNKSDDFTAPGSLNTAVLFLVFNRLDTTKQVVEAVKKAKPTILYLASDGPRISHKADVNKIAAVREYVNNNIDWNCEVKTLFRKENIDRSVNRCISSPGAGWPWYLA